LAVGYVLTLSGFLGTGLEGSGSILLEPFPDESCCNISCVLYFEAPVYSGTAGSGLWKDDVKTLQMRVRNSIALGTVLKFSWYLRNSDVGQDAQAIRISGQGDNMTLAEQKLQYETGNNAPLLIGRFVLLSGMQETAVVNTLNEITVEIQFNCDLENAKLVISGLVQSNTEDQILQIHHTHTHDLASTGAWTQATGNLELEIMRAEALVNYTFTFTLTNPSFGQQSPSIFARVESELVNITTFSMKYPDDDFSPLFVFGVSFIELGQSSEFAGAVNNLTLRIASSVEHVAPTKITLSGLLPTQTSSGPLLVLTDDGYGVFASIAQWNSTEGSLQIEILTTMTKKIAYTISFQVFSVATQYAGRCCYTICWALLLHNMQGR
jgi:hypothetical protein